MNAQVSPICDSEIARQNLLREIERLGDVVQDMEGRLHQVTVAQPCAVGVTCSGEQKAAIRSILADEIYNRAERVMLITDRLINLRNSLDL